ncbi:LutC/YkgG family protein [Streptacidiphilus melanogenes]|uniref:LutC/YkgG family protein n=1 Tax=Streptacidiphilus melanogenes TaxID=411235 RepID=UPI0005A72906|nr:LUD domain-containing protein [Streptacidiphilus melanogenes]
MTARDTVLGRIRAALADVPAEEAVGDAPVPRDYRRGRAEADAVGLFAERVADYRARVVQTTPERARATIAGLLAGSDVRTLVVPPAFPPDLVPEGPWQRLEEPLEPGDLEAADTVLTTCRAGIAVTGTIVLDAGPGQGRRALTLLPDHHLCVVRAEQIVADVPDAIALLDPGRPLTFVSGPSATSDIELDRVEGVHGPRSLDVVIVREEPHV